MEVTLLQKYFTNLVDVLVAVMELEQEQIPGEHHRSHRMGELNGYGLRQCWGIPRSEIFRIGQ